MQPNITHWTLKCLNSYGKTHCFGKDTHELRELMCEHGQHGSEGAKARCEEDEEGKLFLRVHGHLVESCSNSGRVQGGVGGAVHYESRYMKKKTSVDQQDDVSPAVVTHKAAVPCLLFPCILGKGKTSDPFLGGRELSGRLKAQTRHMGLDELIN